jgi:hypothetical protein
VKGSAAARVAIIFVARLCSAGIEARASEGVTIEEVDAISRELAAVKLPQPYVAVLGRMGTADLQQRLRQHTQLAPATDDKAAFLTRFLLTDPGADVGCFTLELRGDAQGGSAPENRTVHSATVRFYQPRGRVTGPLTCEDGYRQYVLRRPAPRTATKASGSPGAGAIVGGIVGPTRRGKAPASYAWLPPSRVDDVAQALRELHFPVAHDKVVAVLAPSHQQGQLPRSLKMSAATPDVVPVEVEVRFTDPSASEGYYALFMEGQEARGGAGRDRTTIRRAVVRYYMPVGKVTASAEAERGYRVLDLDTSPPP